MVRKVSAFICCFVLLAALCGSAQAATHSVYDGSFSTTYVTYFRDIVSGISFNDNYVAFRSGQYEYTMIVGDIEYDGSSFNLISPGTEYIFSSDSSYNSTYSYSSSDIDSFSLDNNNYIIYSDLGKFPQLVERGAKYEMLSAVLCITALLGVVIGRFFRRR